MVKQVRSWSKPDNDPGLIGRKKVDLSLFRYGIHIPAEFHEDFEKANENIRLERKKSHEVHLIFDDHTFTVMLLNIDQKNKATDTLQLRWDGKSQFKKYLEDRFKSSYDYIMQRAEQLVDEEKQNKIIVPDDLAEYISFYETDTPFHYRVKISTVRSGSEYLPHPFS